MSPGPSRAHTGTAHSVTSKGQNHVRPLLPPPFLHKLPCPFLQDPMVTPTMGGPAGSSVTQISWALIGQDLEDNSSHLSSLTLRLALHCEPHVDYFIAVTTSPW